MVLIFVAFGCAEIPAEIPEWPASRNELAGSEIQTRVEVGQPPVEV